MRSNNLHPLQSFLWGKFRKKTGVGVISANNLLLTLHPIPHTKYTIGYLPKSFLPTKQMLIDLKKTVSGKNCIFIQIEPDVEDSENLKSEIKKLGLIPSARPLFTKYNFVLDLTKTEEELLRNMHPKTRYNIKLAEKKGVSVKEDNSDKAFNEYLKLTKETTKRQKFYAHSQNYHKLMWETLKPMTNDQRPRTDILRAHLLKAKYEGEVLVAWVLFVLGDTLYYPYGASSDKHREVMASNLMMWEAIKFGKKLGLKKFDMWGALSQNPDTKDSWYGFHKFKEGYGAKHIEYLGSYDFVINKNLYSLYKILNKLRWFLLKLK
ncbi:MAG: peptidoglycan bridge formation glycyltransferase FemA/FemB family protein [Patescibacteria group bacterium]